LDNPAPVMPPLSIKAGEQGRVLLKVQVEANGTPSRVDIHKSSGFERLDRAALNAVLRWKFAPAKLGSVAVAASVMVPIDFSIRQ
jgi:periplasmic protein TonB